MPALSPTEVAKLHEIVGLSDYTAADVSDLAAELSDEQRDLVRADITAWDAVKNDDDRIQGGRAGIDIDPARDRRRIRQRTLRRLGIGGGSTSGLVSIPLTSPWAR